MWCWVAPQYVFQYFTLNDVSCVPICPLRPLWQDIISCYYFQVLFTKPIRHSSISTSSVLHSPHSRGSFSFLLGFLLGGRDFPREGGRLPSSQNLCNPPRCPPPPDQTPSKPLKCPSLSGNFPRENPGCHK